MVGQGASLDGQPKHGLFDLNWQMEGHVCGGPGARVNSNRTFGKIFEAFGPTSSTSFN